MIFKGINNQTVEFRITNYQFPEITDCEYDSNWLLVYLKVKSDFENWETIDPSLLVKDLRKIVNWFEQLSNNIELDSDSLVFIEPNLEFELIKNQSDLKTVRIKFDLESRPQNANDEKEYFVDCELSNAELNEIALELKKELDNYPERALNNTKKSYIKNINLFLSITAILIVLIDFFKTNEFHLERGYIDIFVLLLLLNAFRSTFGNQSRLRLIGSMIKIGLFGFLLYNITILGILSFGIGFTGRSFPLIMWLSIIINLALMVVLVVETIQINKTKIKRNDM